MGEALKGPPTMTATEEATTSAAPSTRPALLLDSPAACADTHETAAKGEIEATEEAFTPDSSAKVDWVLAKIASRRAAAALIRENGEAMAREEEREAEALEWRYGPAIQTWLNGELKDGHKKSKRLYHGVVGYRTRPAGVSVTNPAAAMSWARTSCPAAVTETLDRKALTARLLETGEDVDFAFFQPEQETFYIKS